MNIWGTPWFLAMCMRAKRWARGEEAAGAEVEVPGLGFAHRIFGQTHRFAAGPEGGERMFGAQPVHDRGAGLKDKVAVRVVAMAPAVGDEEQHPPGAGYKPAPTSYDQGGAGHGRGLFPGPEL